MRGCLTTHVIILAIDTATAATTVAIGGADVDAVRTRVDAHRHAESVAPMIAEVMAEAGVAPSDIDVITCGVGPGPFTGLRVGISTAIAMGTALDRPVVGVCTHDVIARAVAPMDARGVLVATTARRAEAFVSTYGASGDGALGERESGPLALSHDDARAAIAACDLVCAGDAVDTLAPDLSMVRTGPRYPSARDLVAIVGARVAAGEDWRAVTAAPVELDAATSQGDSTALFLDERARQGRVLLPPRPLYLRVPDAVAAPPASSTANRGSS